MRFVPPAMLFVLLSTNLRLDSTAVSDFEKLEKNAVFWFRRELWLEDNTAQ